MVDGLFDFLRLFSVSFSLSCRWVVLTVTWFLAAGLKWGNEAIEQKSPYFHGVAWSIPAALTIAVLITSKIEGDVLSGVGAHVPVSSALHVDRFVNVWNLALFRQFAAFASLLKVCYKFQVQISWRGSSGVIGTSLHIGVKGLNPSANFLNGKSNSRNNTHVQSYNLVQIESYSKIQMILFE